MLPSRAESHPRSDRSSSTRSCGSGPVGALLGGGSEMRTAPDSPPICAPDSFIVSDIAPNSGGPIPLGLGAAADLFCAARAAEGASSRMVDWYRMILVRVVRRFGEARPIDAIGGAELRGWLLELRATLSPESVAGYVRGLKAFGNWWAAEEGLRPAPWAGGPSPRNTPKPELSTSSTAVTGPSAVDPSRPRRRRR
jgi:hypothetical protein